ncbi:MAG: 3-methyl-2-oxobutanoate hydroxymethyltransferase [Alphaproteobacteria bacterium]|nr:MAG: 3-methyl-2-oxobutanoate hydroxymethyltransferase [Alphaproteobacteria bacterium]
MKKTKYKKVFSMTGELGLRNYTVKDIIDLKGDRQLTQTLPFTPNEAKAAEDAGIDLINTRFNYFKQETAIEIRKSASKTFMSFVIPLLSVPTKDDALKHSYKAMELGADGIIFQGSLNHIEALSNAGIPVQGHIGLVPRKSTWTGGIRAVGKTLDEAKALFQNLKDLENAGAWAVECEVIPSRLMRELSSRTSLVTISIGSGNGGDVQFLFAEDILGASEGPFPRHSKQYCNLFKESQRIQKMRVNAFKDFIDDVNSDNFPSNNFEVEVTEEFVERFCNYLDKT